MARIDAQARHEQQLAVAVQQRAVRPQAGTTRGLELLLQAARQATPARLGSARRRCVRAASQSRSSCGASPGPGARRTSRVPPHASTGVIAGLAAGRASCGGGRGAKRRRFREPQAAIVKPQFTCADRPACHLDPRQFPQQALHQASGTRAAEPQPSQARSALLRRAGDSLRQPPAAGFIAAASA